MYFIVIKDKVRLRHPNFLTLVEMTEILIEKEAINASNRIELWDDERLICRHVYEHEEYEDDWPWKEPVHLVK